MATIQIAHPRRSVESYAHKAAKATLAGWFRDAAAASESLYANPCGIWFRPNRGAPYWGVWEEYPFVGQHLGQNPVWDEQDWFDKLEAKRVHGHLDYGLALRDCGRYTLKTVEIIRERTYTRTKIPGYTYLSFHTYECGPSAEIPDGRQPHPTFEELKEIGTIPDAIADVAVQHKGTIAYAFEVVHKHGLTDKKRAFLRTLDCTTMVLDAGWILAQVECPKRLRVREVINGYANGVELADLG